MDVEETTFELSDFIGVNATEEVVQVFLDSDNTIATTNALWM